MMNEEIFTYIVDLPDKVNEVVMPCPDFGYTIYINAKLDYHDRVKAYNHALRHIENYDFESEESVGIIEARAHEE